MRFLYLLYATVFFGQVLSFEPRYYELGGSKSCVFLQSHYQGKLHSRGGKRYPKTLIVHFPQGNSHISGEEEGVEESRGILLFCNFPVEISIRNKQCNFSGGGRWLVGWLVGWLF